MKKVLLFLPAGIVSMMMVALVVSTAFGQEQDGPVAHNSDTFVSNFCFEGKVLEMDVSDIVNTYTKKTNEFFNKNIEFIMTNPQEEIPAIDLNEYEQNGGGLCKDADGNPANDTACKAIALCKDSASPYCVGITALGFSPERYKNYDDTVLQNFQQLQYSYFCYKGALEFKRQDIFDGSAASILAKCDNGSEFADEKVCKLKAQIAEEKDPAKKYNLQYQLDSQINKGSFWALRDATSSLTATVIDLSEKTSKRLKFIDDEIGRSKNALDQTLDAYSQLRISWGMHVQYMDTYSDLVKYRDYLVSIRKQTDTFQFKFIDATTTKCL